MVLAAGAAGRLAWLALGFFRLARLRRAAQPLDDPLPAPLAHARALAGARATLALSGTLAGPVTFGLRRPVVLLPRAFLDLDPAFQMTVVCHELLHVRRRDWAWSIAEELVVALLWFHPAVWWLVAQIHLSREQVIDREVVRQTGQRKPYVEALMHLAGARAPAALAAATPFLRRRHLVRRLALLLTEAHMSGTRLAVSLAAVTVALVTVGVVSVAAFPLVSPAAVSAVAQQQVVPSPPPKAPPPPKLVHEVKPTYPLLAQKAKVQGVVELELTIEPDGTVSGARVLRSIPLLDEAAIDAARQWKFEPSGQRVAVDVELTFTLKDDASRDPWTVTFSPAVAGASATTAGTDYSLRTVVYPKYPADALAAGLEGSVHLTATLHADGTFTDVKAMDGPELFRTISVDAVRRWIAGRQLTPASGSVPVAIEMVFAIKNGAGTVGFGVTVRSPGGTGL